MVDVLAEIRSAAERLAPHVRRTPVQRAPELDPPDGEVWLKLECFQRTGSFKLRGATNKILTLPEGTPAVVTASSGNHGMAVASGASRLGIPARVYVPEGAAPTKCAAMRGLGAEVVTFGTDFVDAEAEAQRDAVRTGAAYISAYNDPIVMAGQGTVGVDLEAQIPDLDAVFVAVGGGGLIGGIGSWLRRERDVAMVAVSPANSAVLHRSLEAGKILHFESFPTLSDGTSGGLEDGSITFPVCQEVVGRSITVTEDEIAAAMRHVIGTHHMLIEGSAGAAVAGWMKLRDAFAGKRVAIVLCGANVGIETLRGVLEDQG
ncbi:MAG: threonine/serine dehydratase [Proteobacteria bacterium]|nr:threonine/serine dehydratase [Pseudomonadota bacterium]